MGKSAGSLVGVVAMAAVGGLVGGLFIPGAFSSLGASFGVMIGGMLFAQPQPAATSSVQDLKANKAESTFLPIWCGDDIDDVARPGFTTKGGVYLPGIIVKTAPDGGVTKVKQKKKKQGGGTGGRLFGTPSGEDYDYFLSCAVAWGEGSTENPGILRELWADDALIVNIDATSEEDGYVARTPIHDALGNEVGWQSKNLRHYYGTGTQPVDDMMEAWYHAEGHHAPALRGTEYTVVLNLKLSGHVPQFYGRHTNGVKDRSQQCKFFLLRANGLDGLTNLPVDSLHLENIAGQSRGWYMTQPQAPRAIAELVASRSLCALVEHSYGIHAVDLQNPTIWTLEEWELAATDGDGGERDEAPQRFKRGLEQPSMKPSRVEVRYFDIRKRDENSVPATMPTAQHENIQTFDLPCVDVEEEIAVWGQIMMDAAWVAQPGAVSTLPRRITATAGDVLRVPIKKKPGQFREIIIENRVLSAPGAIAFEGKTWSAETYRNRPVVAPTPRPEEARVWGAPIVFVANSVVISAEMMKSAGVLVAAAQTPDYKWGSGAVIHIDGLRPNGGYDELAQITVEEMATMGQLLSDWTPPSFYDGYTSASPISVEMFNGSLATAPLSEVRAGANVLLFECGTLVSFASATPTGLTEQGLGRYSLGLLKAGRWGSDDLTPYVLPAGSRFIVISDENGEQSDNANLEFRTLKIGLKGKNLRARASCLEKPNFEATKDFIFEAANLSEPSPVSVRARRTEGEGLELSGRSRSRDRNDDGWESARINLTAPRKNGLYRFRVQLASNGAIREVDMTSNDDGGTFAWTWTSAQLNAIFGFSPDFLAGSVAIVGEWGVGNSRSWAT